MLQTLGSNESYRSGGSDFGEDQAQGINFGHYADILKRRFFYFLLPFGIVSVLGLYLVAIQKPSYLSEGKILVESPAIAPDLVRPIITASASERIQLIQQRIMTRDNLLSIASRFGLFPKQSEVLDLMRKSTQIRPVELEGQPRQGTSAIAFTVGFEYEIPEVAMTVANEFLTLIVDADARSQTTRATEAVKILTAEAKDIEDKLEATQTQIFEAARRPRDTSTEIPEQQKAQQTILSALKAELIQKMSVYSDGHPAVVALKKRIAEMEKALAQAARAPAKAQSTQADDIEAMKRQREALEKRLADANNKIAVARLSEKLDRDQQSERLQIIETPPLPQRPLKSKAFKMAALALAAAAMLGIGAVIAAELFDGSIHHRQQLAAVVDSHLIVSVPYITTQADVTRARLRIIFGAVAVVVLLVALGGLAAAIVLHLPVDFAWADRSEVVFSAANR